MRARLPSLGRRAECRNSRGVIHPGKYSARVMTGSCAREAEKLQKKDTGDSTASWGINVRRCAKSDTKIFHLVSNAIA